MTPSHDLVTPADPAPTCPCCRQRIDPLAVLLEPARCLVVYGGKFTRLPRQQFRLLEPLARRYPHAVDRDTLISAIVNPDGDRLTPDDSYLEVVICLLRKRIGEIDLRIETHWSHGYSLEVDRDAATGGEKATRSDAMFRGRTSFTAGDVLLVTGLRERRFTMSAIARQTQLTYRTVAEILAIADERQEAAVAQALAQGGAAA